MLVDLTLLYVFVEYLNIHYLQAASISFLVSATVNYVISSLTIFVNAQNTITRSYTTFMGLSVFGLLAINIGLYVLVDIFDVYYLLARLLLAGTIGVSSFFLHKYISFKDLAKFRQF